MNTNKKAFTNQRTLSINGVTITDNGDGTYAHSLPTATGGTQTISDNGDGAAVVNNYTSSGTLTGSETTGFDADSRKRYKHRSCLRTYILGCSTKKCLKTAQKDEKSVRIRTNNANEAIKRGDLENKSSQIRLFMCISSYEMSSIKASHEDELQFKSNNDYPKQVANRKGGRVSA